MRHVASGAAPQPGEGTATRRQPPPARPLRLGARGMPNPRGPGRPRWRLASRALRALGRAAEAARSGPLRQVRAGRPRPPAARPTFSVSPAPSAPAPRPSPPLLSLPALPPPPAWSCVAFFCLQWKQFLAARRAPAPTRRGGGEREAGRGGESGGAGGRTRGAPGGRRRSHAAPRPPRPCPRPPPAARRPGLAAPRPRLPPGVPERCPLGARESLPAALKGSGAPAPAPAR